MLEGQKGLLKTAEVSFILLLTNGSRETTVCMIFEDWIMASQSVGNWKNCPGSGMPRTVRRTPPDHSGFSGVRNRVFSLELIAPWPNP